MIRIKICGVTRGADAIGAVEAGVDALGFNFWSRSPRFVNPSEVERMSADLPPFVTRVGVFVDENPVRIADIAASVGLDVVQLHGDEGPILARTLERRVIRAVRARSGADLEGLAEYEASALLVDAWVEGEPGGTGAVANWDVARSAKAIGPVILAGGLTPENVGDAIPGRRAVRGRRGERGRDGSRREGRRADPGVRPGSPGSLAGARAVRSAPDAGGHFGGRYGGRYVPETVIPACVELEQAWKDARRDRAFRADLDALLEEYAGRPTALTRAARVSEDLGIELYLKREDLCHTGAHKINNTLGQVLLARRMGKRRIIAETGAGQHGVATATACALFGLECIVYMGEEDIERQALNVFRMRSWGPRSCPSRRGAAPSRTRRARRSRDWATHVERTHYIIGSTVGPHPYPWMVRELQSVIGVETKRQIRKAIGRLPDVVVACVGGGSNSSGMFHPFLEDGVRLVGVEAAGHGLSTGQHGAPLRKGSPGVLHGSLSFVIQDRDGQIRPAHSISAGLDYPGVGPELASWKESGAVEFSAATDREALASFRYLAEHEGIVPALESSHAIAWIRREARSLGQGTVVVLNLSGRGDKDVVQVAEAIGDDL